MKKVSTNGMLSMIGLVLLLVASTPAMSVSNDDWSPPFYLSGWQVDVPVFRLRLGSDGTAAAFWKVENTSLRPRGRAREPFRTRNATNDTRSVTARSVSDEAVSTW